MAEFQIEAGRSVKQFQLSISHLHAESFRPFFDEALGPSENGEPERGRRQLMRLQGRFTGGPWSRQWPTGSGRGAICRLWRHEGTNTERSPLTRPSCREQIDL